MMSRSMPCRLLDVTSHARCDNLTVAQTRASLRGSNNVDAGCRHVDAEPARKDDLHGWREIAKSRRMEGFDKLDRKSARRHHAAQRAAPSADHDVFAVARDRDCRVAQKPQRHRQRPALADELVVDEKARLLAPD